MTAAVAVALAVVHLLAGRLRLLDVLPRSGWLSFGGGISVAYVFVHILPALAKNQRHFDGTASTWIGAIEHHVYLIALVGLGVFYGLERLARRSRGHGRSAGRSPGEAATSPGVFWIHIGTYAAYNALIGYLLLHGESPGRRELGLYTVAMAAHFVVNDYGLRQDHQRRYHDIGRWILSAAIVVGWLLGVVTSIHRAAIAACFGFLAGGILLNVLKEELPEERDSTFWAFALGAVAYAALLLLG
ncbi:MAG: hypothetical protein H0T76_12295 [Nannocystis sp.]|nr:hypothetical protein [Nannocystis sp.]MBA3547257.1 hypothetical protein [Nannocystis sp.]